jgi:phthalate 4,5-cis-dihydrodiol dehydrogenase
MIAAAQANGVHLVVGHTHSFDPPVLKIREIVRSGELGPLAMINTWSYGNFLYRPRRPEELDTAQGGGIIYNQVPHQVDVVRLIGGGMVRSVRSMAWVLDPARPTEGSHVTFLQFEDGAAASLVFSGYDHFDSDEFHSWVGELGEEKKPGGHGSARAALRNVGDAQAEAALKTDGAYGKAGEKKNPFAAPAGQWHHPHCGVLIASCARGDLRASADGVLLYGPDGCSEIEVPRGRAYPDKCGVIDELYDAFASGREPLHNGRWGKATMEVALAVLQSARERREIFLKHQVASNDLAST